MGVRMYPITEKPSIIARLLGVSTEEAEAARKYFQIDQMFRESVDCGDEDAGYVFYCLMEEELPGIFRCKDFSLDGWGRFDTRVCDIMESLGYDSTAGHTTSTYEVTWLVAALGIELNGVTIDELEGLSWG